MPYTFNYLNFNLESRGKNFNLEFCTEFLSVFRGVILLLLGINTFGSVSLEGHFLNF